MADLEVVPIEIRNLDPGSHEILDEFLFPVRASIDPSATARSSDCEPMTRSALVAVHLASAGLAVEALEHLAVVLADLPAVLLSRRFTEKSLVSRPGRLVKTPRKIHRSCVRRTKTAKQDGQLGRGTG